MSRKTCLVHHIFKFPLLMALMACIIPSSAWGQAVSGTILGSVTDPTGARVPGIQVSAFNVNTGVRQTATTDSEGNYLFPVLQVGEYRVEAESSGFRKFVREGIILDVNRNARVDITLAVGSVAEEVTLTIS